jgi:hypothetical protein
MLTCYKNYIWTVASWPAPVQTQHMPVRSHARDVKRNIFRGRVTLVADGRTTPGASDTNCCQSVLRTAAGDAQAFLETSGHTN